MQSMISHLLRLGVNWKGKHHFLQVLVLYFDCKVVAHNDASQEDEWISSAMEKMFVEKTNRQRAPLVLLDYQGSVAIDIIFKDDSSLPGGSYFRTIWTLFVHNIRNGIIRQGWGNHILEMFRHANL